MGGKLVVSDLNVTILALHSPVGARFSYVLLNPSELATKRATGVTTLILFGVIRAPVFHLGAPPLAQMLLEIHPGNRRLAQSAFRRDGKRPKVDSFTRPLQDQVGGAWILDFVFCNTFGFFSFPIRGNAVSIAGTGVIELELAVFVGRIPFALFGTEKGASRRRTTCHHAEQADKLVIALYAKFKPCVTVIVSCLVQLWI